MAKNRKYQKQLFESDCSNSDTSANIYESMLLSNAWKDLSANQKCLYLYCKSQYYSEKNKFEGNRTTFTMNRHKWLNKYNIYNQGNEKAFYRDMNELISHGFIICVKCGAIARQKNIYEYSEKWHKWGTAQFELSNSEMTKAMLNKKYPDKL